MANKRGKSGSSDRFYFLGLQSHFGLWLQPWNLKDSCSWKESYDKLRQQIKNQRHRFADKGLGSQSYGFSSSRVRMWELDHKEGWVPKTWCSLTVVLKTLESPLDSKIKPVNPKGNKSWIFTGRTEAEAEALVLWLPDVKSWLIRKDPHAGKDWRQEEKGITEEEIVGSHFWLNGHEFEQAPGDSEGQGRLAVLQSMGSQRVRNDWVTKQQSEVWAVENKTLKHGRD